jgi:hypothetical protein
LFFVASRDIVRNVQLIAAVEDSDHLTANSKSFNYHISWLEPLEPNGLIYFYVIYIGQDRINGPKEEHCVGNDVHSAINSTNLFYEFVFTTKDLSSKISIEFFLFFSLHVFCCFSR